MVFAKVHIIIEPCTRFMCNTQQTAHNRTYGRIDREERTEEHHVILIYPRQFTVHTNRRMVFIEYILRIVVFIQESQRYMRLDLLMATNIFRRHTIVKQIAANQVAHMVTSHLCHHGARHASPSERNNTVECRAARNSLLGLVVLEQNIQHCLTYTYYTFFGHIIRCLFLMAAKIEKMPLPERYSY